MTNNRNREEEDINSAFGQGIKEACDAQLGMRLKDEERSVNKRRGRTWLSRKSKGVDAWVCVACPGIREVSDIAQA